MSKYDELVKVLDQRIKAKKITETRGIATYAEKIVSGFADFLGVKKQALGLELDLTKAAILSRWTHV